MKPARAVYSVTALLWGCQPNFLHFQEQWNIWNFYVVSVSKYLKLAANANILITPQCGQTCGWSGHSPQDSRLSFKAPQMEESMAGTSLLGHRGRGESGQENVDRIQDAVTSTHGPSPVGSGLPEVRVGEGGFATPGRGGVNQIWVTPILQVRKLRTARAGDP